MRERLLATASRFGLHVDPDARVGELSVGERQRVEILKALVRGARILILDEPTAVLTPQESEALFATLRQLVAEGLSIVFISHKLDEVLRVSDRVAVLRAGQLVALLPAAGTSKSELAELMVGRVVEMPRREHREDRATGPEVLRLERVEVRDAKGRVLLHELSLTVRGGEVVAVAGVAGNGQGALADLLSGLLGVHSGRLALAGKLMQPSPRDWVDAAVARIPEDRHAVGVVGDLPLWENSMAERLHAPDFSRLGLVRQARARDFARKLVRRFDVRGAGIEAPARSLSGGNLQKLILGRALAVGGDSPPALVLANQPTWGLDVGAVAYVHQCLLDAAAQGAAVLLISEDLDEIFALADRIAVMHQGRLGAARDPDDWTLVGIGLAMAGAASTGEPPSAEAEPLHAD